MWDNETTFSNRQILADAASDNQVDTGGDDFGLGEPIYLQVSLTAGSSGTLAVNVETSDSPGMGDAVRVVQYLVAPETVARGGTVLAAPLPTGCKRYLRLSYAGAIGGRVTAGLVAGVQSNGMRRK